MSGYGHSIAKSMLNIFCGEHFFRISSNNQVICLLNCKTHSNGQNWHKSRILYSHDVSVNKNGLFSFECFTIESVIYLTLRQNI